MKKNIKFEFKGNVFDLSVEREENKITIDNGDEKYTVTLMDDSTLTRKKPIPVVDGVPVPAAIPFAQSGGITEKASITGIIKEIVVSKGDSVKNGDLLLIMEAMKMDIEVFASQSGDIQDIFVSSGMNVTAGQDLVGIA